MDVNKDIGKLIKELVEKSKNENGEFLNYLVPHILAKDLSSLMLIREDILFAKNAIEKLIKLKNANSKDEVVESSLWYSAIVQYNRCFNENKGGYSRLEANHLFKLPDDQLLKETHDNLLELRNSFVAHRDYTEYEQAIVVMQIPLKGDVDKISFNIKSAQTFGQSTSLLQNYVKLFDFLLPKIQSKIQVRADKTKDGLLKNFSPEEINLLLLR